MAERVRLAIAAGQRDRQRFEWGDLRLGPAGDLGSLEWSAVVLGAEQLTIDLEVSARLRGSEAPPAAQPAEAGTEATVSVPRPHNVVLLQGGHPVRSFRGSFDPVTDPRLSEAHTARGEVRPVVEAIIFDFSNQFSWLTAKEIELVILRVRPSGPVPSLLPPLMSPGVSEALPRGVGRPLGGEGGRWGLPVLATALSREAVEKAQETGSGAALRFAQQLDEWLGHLDGEHSNGDCLAAPWLGQLLDKVALLRGTCKEAAAKAESRVAAEASRATAALAREEQLEAMQGSTPLQQLRQQMAKAEATLAEGPPAPPTGVAVATVAAAAHRTAAVAAPQATAAPGVGAAAEVPPAVAPVGAPSPAAAAAPAAAPAADKLLPERAVPPRQRQLEAVPAAKNAPAAAVATTATVAEPTSVMAAAAALEARAAAAPAATTDPARATPKVLAKPDPIAAPAATATAPEAKAAPKSPARVAAAAAAPSSPATATTPAKAVAPAAPAITSPAKAAPKGPAGADIASAPAAQSAPALTREVLKAQDDRTSAAIIDFLRGDSVFEELARTELEGIAARDREDGDKLQAGVEQAVHKGVLPGDLVLPSYEQIDVMGKSADEVAEEIMAKLPQDGGCIVILVGLSGTGKGTTVEKLKQRLPRAAAWSNGNCFRALTLLAATFCEQQGKDGFVPECLTPENLAAWANMLKFDKYDGSFDIRIQGLGLDVRVSQVANTLLKEPRVSKNIPAVAKETQGEVVSFAGKAVRRMGDEGTVVLLEGREQTLNFIPSPYRFCLTMSDVSLIGARRAAQRIAAVAAVRAGGGGGARLAVRVSLAEVSAAT